MNEDKQNDTSPLNGNDTASKAEPNDSKRRLLKGVVGVTPAILAISSKPVLAGFCGVSGFLSGNLSNHQGEQSCGGHSPGYYKSHIPKNDKTTFYHVFGGVWRGRSGNWPEPGYGSSTPTFHDVVYMQGYEDQYEFGAHAVAAYLNAANIPGYGLTTVQVVQMVGEVLAFGYYTDPGTGKTLDPVQLKEFFYQTFD